ncbi:uncharacterized protein [Ptychodera flava]|uniref:uncharacterized protein n=1 Tax=Ptychodera flava TaxID=63121 RepID=UPI003969BC16
MATDGVNFLKGFPKRPPWYLRDLHVMSWKRVIASWQQAESNNKTYRPGTHVVKWSRHCRVRRCAVCDALCKAEKKKKDSKNRGRPSQYQDSDISGITGKETGKRETTDCATAYLQYNTEQCVYQSIAGDHCFSSVSPFPIRSHHTPVPIPDPINTETSNDETSRDRQNNICAVKAAEIVLQNVSAVHMLLQYEEMATTLVKKKIEANRSDDSLIKVKTKGQPLCLTYTTKPRKTTSEASTRTRRQRVLQLSQRRDIVSGGDAMLQLSERR